MQKVDTHRRNGGWWPKGSSDKVTADIPPVLSEMPRWAKAYPQTAKNLNYMLCAKLW